MTLFETRHLPAEPTATAPDGSDVRVLLGLAGGGMAHFSLEAGRTAKAVRHRTVEEIWFVVGGAGEMWRRSETPDRQAVEQTVDLLPGVCLTIPLGTTFQFRALGDAGRGDAPLTVVAVTMPPWPGEGEAVPVPGPWIPDVGA
jgi:mannose-6-phosphate isomerase-like protein (cupin superfamily)